MAVDAMKIEKGKNPSELAGKDSISFCSKRHIDSLWLKLEK
jgi:hypothetical protein